MNKALKSLRSQSFAKGCPYVSMVCQEKKKSVLILLIFFNYQYALKFEIVEQGCGTISKSLGWVHFLQHVEIGV